MANTAIQKFSTVSMLLSKNLVLVLNRLHTFMLRPLQLEENVCNVRNMLLKMNNIVSKQTVDIGQFTSAINSLQFILGKKLFSRNGFDYILDNRATRKSHKGYLDIYYSRPLYSNMI